MRLAELAQPLAGLPGGADRLAVLVQLEDLAGEAAHHVHRPVAVDEQPAWQALVGPLLHVGPLAVEDLHATVLPVGDVDQPFVVHDDRVRRVELARPGAGTAPVVNQRTFGVELQHARNALAVADEDVDLAFEADGQIGRLLEEGRVVRVDRHQDVALGVHLADGVAVDVGGPDVSFTVDAHAMRPVVLPLAPRTDERAVRLELHQRVRSAVEDQEPARRGPADAGRGAHFDVGGDLQSGLDRVVTQVRRIFHLRRIGRVKDLRAGEGGPAEEDEDGGGKRPNQASV